jgi:hypothetical protein
VFEASDKEFTEAMTVIKKYGDSSISMDKIENPALQRRFAKL